MKKFCLLILSLFELSLLKGCTAEVTAPPPPAINVGFSHFRILC